MGLRKHLRRLFGRVEENEDRIANQVGKRTGMSERQARNGIEKARDVVDDESSDSHADNDTDSPSSITDIRAGSHSDQSNS